tara:strand:+ start:83498 stop:84268 length:771 start_codon:yes stop_codon:yes gene_type:complete
MQKNRPIFISSSGRSGSTSLVGALSKVKNIDAYHGPGYKELEKVNCLSYLRSRGMSNISEKEIIRMIKRNRDSMIQKSNLSGCTYVESSWFISALLPEIIKAYPDAIVIHLVRDGRDFVRSGMNRFWFSGNPKNLKRINAWTRDRWTPVSGCKTRFQKICWLWAEQQRVMKNGLGKIPNKNNFGTVKFEDLIAGDIRWFLKKVRINASNNIKVSMEKLNKTSGKFVIDKWGNWSAGEKNDAKVWMGKELKYFGYKW